VVGGRPRTWASRGGPPVPDRIWPLDLRIRWVLKAELCRPPHGWFLTGLGALPIQRDGTMQVTDRLIQECESRDELLLAIAPPGTRKRTEHWRSGFYWIAKGADVPIVLGFVDYSTRRAGLGPLLHTTDDLTADMDRMRAFYADIRGLKPEQESTVRLKDEAP
jgi:1-acyl-sn-glycerol-3-phosphate acyltransferase